MRWAFEQIEREVVTTVRRLAALEDPPGLLLAKRAQSGDRAAEIEIEETDLTSTGRLKPAALERARDFASDVAHAVNAAAPLGVRWTARIFFEHEEPRLRTASLELKPARLTAWWAVVLDPAWTAPGEEPRRG